MALPESCANADGDLCSGQQNWTWSHYICSAIEEEAQLNDSELVCYFIKLATFVLNFCSQLPKWKLDHMSCLQQFGTSAGMCNSVFPDLNSEPFLDCFNTVVENAGERQNQSNTDWFYHIQNALCFNKTTSHVGICMDTNVLSTVFNITWYAPSETVIATYSYVFPAVGALVILFNLLLLIVMLQIISNDSFMLLICIVSVCETLVVITICSMFLGVFTAESYHDYIPYGWCIVIYFIFDILTPLFHATSCWMILGLAIQRYLIIKYPFIARRYQGKKSRNLVLLYLTFTMLLISLSFVPQMMCITKIKQWPMMSKLDIRKEIVTAAVPHDRAFYDLKNTAYTLCGFVTKVAPTLMMIIFEIALIMALYKHQKQQKKMTNSQPVNKQIRLINILTSIIVMTVLVSEIPSTFAAFLAIAGNSIDLQNSIALLNYFPIILYPANLVLCCCIAKDFRDKLFECVRNLTRCKQQKCSDIE